MKIKTSELSGHTLDWAVAKCEGLLFSKSRTHGDTFLHCGKHYNYSTNWTLGGSIIEREMIVSLPLIDFQDETIWKAGKWYDYLCMDYEQEGETPLVAAMRCYVTSKLGHEVDIPKELL